MAWALNNRSGPRRARDPDPSEPYGEAPPLEATTLEETGIASLGGNGERLGAVLRAPSPRRPRGPAMTPAEIARRAREFLELRNGGHLRRPD
jgi:hypothetical protein